MKEYPEPNEKKWNPKAKLSEGEIIINDSAIKITSDGLRGYICTHCGKIITEAHHIKPNKYKIIINGEIYYAERHVCNRYMFFHKINVILFKLIGDKVEDGEKHE
jgi:hypothetical protein